MKRVLCINEHGCDEALTERVGHLNFDHLSNENGIQVKEGEM